MPEDRRVQKSKVAIVNSFIELAKHNEISKITITKIADLANIHRKTFYTNFGSIEELIAYIQEKTLRDFDSTLQITIKDNEYINSNFSYMLLQFVDENIDIIRMLYNNYDKNFIERIVFNHKNMIENFFPPLDGINVNKFVDYSTGFILGGLISIIEKWINDDSSTKEDIKKIIDIFCLLTY